MKRTIALGLFACAALAACSSARSPRPQQAGVHATVRAATAAGTLTRVHLSIAPAGVDVDLARDAVTGEFGGFLFVPAGDQTFTATAWVDTLEVGRGVATATLVAQRETVVVLVLLDERGAASPAPAVVPLVTSLVAPSAPGVGQAVTLSATAVDPYDASAALTYAWSASCGGAFGSPAASTTTWTPSAAGPCTITFTATNGSGLAGHGDVLVAVGGVTSCSDLVDASTPVWRQTVQQAVPLPQGGVITDGTYVMTASLEYVGVGGSGTGSGSPEQTTIRIQGSRIEVADARGAKSGTITVDGAATFTVALTCPALETLRMGYTADANSITVFGADGPNTVQTFTRQGVDACTSLPDLGGSVEATALAQAPPVATGGPVVDGTYKLVAATRYTGPGGYTGGSGDFRRGMLRIAAGRVEHRGNDSRESGTFTVSGTTLTVNITCPAPEAMVMSYSASGDTLTIFDAGDPTGSSVEVYQLVPTRTVSGTFTTTYWTDDGNKTTVQQRSLDGATATALLVPDLSAGGFQSVPVTVAADGTFTAEGVPPGRYLVRTEGPALPSPVLTEFTTSTPSFTFVTPTRPDLAFATSPLPVSLQLSGLAPWAKGDQLLLASAQAEVYSRVHNFLSPALDVGETGYTGEFDWTAGVGSLLPIGLPDSAKGDVLYVYQRERRSVVSGDGATTALHYLTTKFARVTDATVAYGAGSALDVALADAPTTPLDVDLRNSRYDALMPEVSPTARIDPYWTALSAALFGLPHAVTGLDAPGDAVTGLGYVQLDPGAPDASFPAVPFADFLDTSWKRAVQVATAYAVSFTAPGATDPADYGAQIYSYVELDPATWGSPLAPVVGPVQMPRVNGADAFAPQGGVGLQPKLSWSAPKLGAATGYTVAVLAVENLAGATNLRPLVTAKVYGTSFQVPPGVLAPGGTYFAVISSVQAPWDAFDGPQRTSPSAFGTPYHSTDCVTATFAP